MNLGSNNLGIFWESNWSIKKCYSNEILQDNQGGFGSCPEFCLVFPTTFMHRVDDYRPYMNLPDLLKK